MTTITIPDTDDTAEVILALRRVALPARGQPCGRRIDRAVRWLTGMQSKDGAWGAFDADNTREIITKLPFCDFGAVIDPPSADVTAHIVEALAAEGLAASKPVRRGVVWLLRHQEPDGSWFGRWGANYIYGTGAAVPALIAAGVLPSKPAIRRAVAWLEAHQNPDGGWGEDLRSYDDPALAGRGTSTASQTAWALLALLAAGGADHAVERGVAWLAATQRADGSWDEPQFTGTGFPGDFYINYHLYRLAFPVSALGRYVREVLDGPARRQASPSGPSGRPIPPIQARTPGERTPPMHRARSTPRRAAGAADRNDPCWCARRCGSRPAPIRRGLRDSAPGQRRRPRCRRGFAHRAADGLRPQRGPPARRKTCARARSACWPSPAPARAWRRSSARATWSWPPRSPASVTAGPGDGPALRSPSAPLLAGELRRAGLRARTGRDRHRRSPGPPCRTGPAGRQGHDGGRHGVGSARRRRRTAVRWPSSGPSPTPRTGRCCTRGG